MAFSDGSGLATGLKLSTVLTDQPQLIEQLALCLDRKMRLIPNWEHLARKLNVDEEVIKRLAQHGDFSPTIRLFEYLEVTQPELTIQQLRSAFLEIRRNELFSLLTTKAGCIDSEKVHEVITSRNIQAPSPRAGLLDEIALALDGTSPILPNWYNLAIKLGVPREACWEFERCSTQNPTNQLFQHLETTRPLMTLKELKEALKSTERKDLLKTLENQNMEDEILLKDVMTPGSELLQIMANKLNRKQPGVQNFIHLAYQLEVPVDVRRELTGESTGQKGKSPTKEIFEWVATRFPDTTLIDLVKALDKIQRNDAIEIITKQFPETVDSSLVCLDSSSLHDNFSIKLPINLPTGEILSVRYKREECGRVSKQVAEDMNQCGHCGSLPDPTDLIGRDDTCEQILTILTSNKAAEIVAPPGHGKTSFVVEVAHRMIKKGTFVAYVNPRGVSCVEDLGSKIIEALGAVPGDDTIKESLRRIRSLNGKRVVLIIENIDNLLHLEDQVSNENVHHELESGVCSAKMHGKYKKDDFLTFLKDVGQSPTIHLILTSREINDFSVSFPIKLIELPPLGDGDSAILFRKRDRNLSDDLIKELVKICGGIPLVICTVLSILQRENPPRLTRKLSSSSPSSLIKALSPDYIANEDRIDQCLQVCFNRLKEENQDVLVMMSTFPHRFTEEQFRAVFQSKLDSDLHMCLDSLKHSSLLRFQRMSSLYSLHPFIRNFFSVKPQHTEAKSDFIRYYSNFAVELCMQFLGKDSKSAIECYWEEKENIREAMTWCGDDHPELDQTLRMHGIENFTKSAVFLAKMMRKQEFESLFCKLSRQCHNVDKGLYSACLTHLGAKTVLSCTCTPQICPRMLYRAKYFLSRANDIQSSLAAFDDATRAQCLSKLGFCLVREGYFDSGYGLLDKALALRQQCCEQSNKSQDTVMLAACFNDLAATLTLQRKHMVAIQTRTNFVLPVYKSILGDHPFLATTFNWIGFSYQALGDYDNAIKFTRQALEIRKQLLGHHKETARSLYDLGVAFSAKEDYKSALKHLEEAVALQKEVLDTPEELILTHQAKLVALMGLGRHEEAGMEMEWAGECAQKLASLEVPLEELADRL